MKQWVMTIIQSIILLVSLAALVMQDGVEILFWFAISMLYMFGILSIFYIPDLLEFRGKSNPNYPLSPLARSHRR